jgi:hypothetical protein
MEGFAIPFLGIRLVGIVHVLRVGLVVFHMSCTVHSCITYLSTGQLGPMKVMRFGMSGMHTPK